MADLLNFFQVFEKDLRAVYFLPTQPSCIGVRRPQFMIRALLGPELAFLLLHVQLRKLRWRLF